METVAGCEGMDGALALHSEAFTAQVLRELPDSVKIIANQSTGVDHIDLDAAAKRGIVVTNTPGVIAAAALGREESIDKRAVSVTLYLKYPPPSP